MKTDTRPGAPMSLGPGRSIEPPAGWDHQGWAVDNPMWLLPKSRMRWTPPGMSQPALHWDLSTSPLPEPFMQALVRLMNGIAGPVSRETLAPLHPALIRMSLESIKTAHLTEFPGSGRLLRLEYDFADSGERGIVCYSPTEMYEFGEFQILAYEGREPAYSQHLKTALEAMETFRTGQPVEKYPQEDLPEEFPEEPEPASSPVYAAAQEAASLPPAPAAPPPMAPQTGSGSIAHTLKEGETMRTVVKQRWPELDGDALMAKVREVYAYNLSLGNPVDAWSLKAGMTIHLPER